MKKLFLLITLFTFMNSFSQKVGDLPISDIKTKYIEVLGTQKFLKPHQVTIFVDYGQISKIKERVKGIVYDKNGDKKVFNGMIDVLNYFSNFGWTLKDAYPITIGNSNVYHYILEKKNYKTTN